MMNNFVRYVLEARNISDEHNLCSISFGIDSFMFIFTTYRDDALAKISINSKRNFPLSPSLARSLAVCIHLAHYNGIRELRTSREYANEMKFGLSFIFSLHAMLSPQKCTSHVCNSKCKNIHRVRDRGNNCSKLYVKKRIE